MYISTSGLSSKVSILHVLLPVLIFALIFMVPRTRLPYLNFIAPQEQFDPSRLWSNYHGAVNYSELPSLYRESDIGIFASTCENMPNILLKMMASGLPVLCSKVPPMPSILGPSAVYFDPEDPYSISQSLCKLIHHPFPLVLPPLL